MRAQRRIQQTQSVLLAGGGLLAVCYFFMYRPLVSTSDALDKPLIALWQRLATTNAQDQTVEGLDVDDIEAMLHQARMSRARFDAVRGGLLSRLDLEPFIARKLGEPFQLIDFQNERQIRISDLEALAEHHSVKLDPRVPEMFPNFPVDLGSPSLLWAQMALAENALATAIRCGVSSISRIDVRPAPDIRNEGRNFGEIMIELELSGEMPAISKFLASLPLRAGELVSMGLPEGPPEKSALFIDRILLLKQSAENFDEVSLKTALAGYVPAHRMWESRIQPPESPP